MHQSAKAARVNKANDENHYISTSHSKCLEILPSHVLLYTGQQQMNGKCVSQKSEILSGPYKRTSNMQSNNIHNKDVHSSLRMPNSFQHFSVKRPLNSSGDYLNNKFNTTFYAKKFVSSKNYLQNIQTHKSHNKIVLETKTSSNKKYENIPNLQDNAKQNQSFCHYAEQKAKEVSILCNIPLNDDKPQNENVMRNKGNQKHEKLGENVEEYCRESREKTPMCLVNDLARYNKIPFQYRLTSEHGPAHCKKFTVTLKLGDEEYTAEGFKIKKAQHLAAKEAIEKTKYKHPIPKIYRRNDSEVKKTNITPTVELNALAMKLGQQTYYILDPKQMLSSKSNKNSETSQISAVMANYNTNQNLHLSDKCDRRYLKLQQSIDTNKSNQLITLDPSYAANCPCKITLIVGNQKFYGIGKSPQQAKHDAAANALQILKTQMTHNKTESHIGISNGIEHKSPISLVFEIGIKRNLPVDFKVLREEGPAHMRIFTTACIVGNIITEGEGSGKKLSKKKAAQKMLEELKNLPPLNSDSAVKQAKIKSPSKKVEIFAINSITDCRKNKKKNIAKQSSNNPVTKVLEWHQINNEKEPIFKLVGESENFENSRRRQFVMEISSSKINARGIGNSKKLAKRDAAQNFLDAVNKYKENFTKNEDFSNNQSECTLDETSTSAEQKNSNFNLDDQTIVTNVKEQNVEQKSENFDEQPVGFAEEKKNSNFFKIKNSIFKSPGLHMKDQLLYLANLLGFEVDFSDYPKGNHNEFLTIVMLSTNPPQISHGVGINSKESQEDASRNALKILSEMGLNNASKS